MKEHIWQNRDVNILVVDDDDSIVEILTDYLQGLDYQVDSARNGVEALKQLGRKRYQLMLTDLNMPKMTGMELIKRAVAINNPPEIIVITAYASMQTAIDAVKLGVYDYLTKPFVFEEVGNAVDRALEKHFLQRENVNLKEMMSLYRASEAISSRHAFDDVVRVLFETAASFTQADFIALYLDKNCNPGAVADFKLHRRQLLAPLAKSQRRLLSMIPRQLSAEMVADHLARHSSRLYRGGDPQLGNILNGTPEPDGFNSMLVFSLKAHNRVVGVMLLFSFTASKPFTDRLRRSFYILASKAAAAIENSCLYDNLQRHYVETVESFALALETKDSYTHGHSLQVAGYALILARALGLGPEEQAALHQAAILHDIGKIGIPDYILNLPRPLTEEEFIEIRKHPAKGRDILVPISSLAEIAEIVYHHHERWDGGGYPMGIKGTRIPLTARIITVADAFDAMTSSRSYRSPLRFREALEELKQQAGRQFDPQLVKLFFTHVDEVRRLMTGHRLRQESGRKPVSQGMLQPTAVDGTA